MTLNYPSLPPHHFIMDQATLIKAYTTVSGMADDMRAEANKHAISSDYWRKCFDQAEAYSNAATAILNIKSND